MCAGCELYEAICGTLGTVHRRAHWRLGMQRALHNYRTRTGIVDEGDEPEPPEASRERYWTPPRTALPIENGGSDDTSTPHQERWLKIWSTDQGAFYYWRQGSGDTQWEDPMDVPSLKNIIVQTWGEAEYEHETEEDPVVSIIIGPKAVQDRPHKKGTCTYEAVQKVMAMPDSGEETEVECDRAWEPSGKDGSTSSRPGKTPGDELPLHLEACDSCAMREVGIDDNGTTFSEGYLGRRRLAYHDQSAGKSPPQGGKCRYCGLEGLYCEGVSPRSSQHNHQFELGGHWQDLTRGTTHNARYGHGSWV